MPKGNNYKGGQNNRRGGGNHNTQSQSLSALIASNKPSFLNPAGAPAAGAAAAATTAAGLTHTVTLSDPKFRTLVSLHEKEEQEKKNREMQAMLDAYVAKAGGTVPAAAQAAPLPVQQPAVTAPPQPVAEKEEEYRKAMMLVYNDVMLPILAKHLLLEDEEGQSGAENLAFSTAIASLSATSSEVKVSVVVAPVDTLIISLSAMINLCK